MSNYAVQILSKLGLDDPAARAIAPKLVIGSYETGQVIWLRDQMLSAWCFLISGIVVGTSPSVNGRRLPMALHGPQNWFGEIPILNDEPTVMDYVCATDVQLIRMPVQTFRDAVSSDPGFSNHILKMTARRAQQQMDLIISLKLDSPTLRTMLGLAQLAESLAVSSESQEALAIPIKQSVVAAMCGVSRTLLSHYLQILQLAGWVRVHYSRLELVSPKAWVRLARTMHRHRLFDRQATIEDMVRELEKVGSEHGLDFEIGIPATPQPSRT